MNVTDYDCFSQAVFEDADRVAAMTQDPYYERYIFNDPPNFADPKNTRYVVRLCIIVPSSLGVPILLSIRKLSLHPRAVVVATIAVVPCDVG